ncbi:MAG: hypothetical protein L0312_03635, partial [Acidobacteria bacterium]|nr:hypothetical protein [Acidobacteriota bacterium]
VSVAKLEKPNWLPPSRDFGSPLPNPGEGLGSEGVHAAAILGNNSRSASVGDGVDLSLTAIPLTADPLCPLAPLGRGEPRIALGLNSTPVLLPDFRDRN